MPLFARNYQELMTDSLEDLAGNTSLTKMSPGGIARALLEATNKRLSETYEVFDVGIARAFVSSAPGQFLELLGVLLGVERDASVAAHTDEDTQVIKVYVESGTFGDINGSQDIAFSQGTILSTETGNGGVLYRTTEEVTLGAAQASAWIGAEAIITGTESNVGTNSLIYHNFTNYTDTLNNTLLVNNVHQIANGKDFESDDNYRFRIVNRVFEVEAANRTAIRLAVLSTPGIADAIMIPRYRGIGTLGVILQSTLPTVSQTLINNVEANVEKVQALGDLAYIRGPLETGVTMNVTVHYSDRLPEDELLDIEDGIRDAIIEHVNDLDIGDPLLINRLASEIFSVSEYVANLGEPGKPFDQVYVHTESKLEDNKVRQLLLGDYTPEDDERVIIEPSYTTPIVLSREYIRR
jgi:uncharacterized phage protein gp47/JayE